MRNTGQKINNIREKIGCSNGSYMDINGNLVLSNAYEPRPNISYNSTSSSFEQTGWLNEVSKYNLCDDTSFSGNLTSYTDEYLVHGVPVHQYTPSSDSNAGIGFSNASGIDTSTKDEFLYIQSFFIKKIAGSTSKIFFSRPWYWGPSATFDLDDGTYSGNAPGINIWKYGNGWWRIGGWNIGYGTITSGASAKLIASSGYSSDFSFIVTCNMYELMDNTNIIISGSNTYNWPSSWIPYKSKREEYINGISYDFETCGRNSIATYFDSSGKLQIAEPYQLRFNYTYSSSAWSLNGYIQEKKKTNLFNSLVFQDSNTVVTTAIDKLCEKDNVYQTAKDMIITSTNFTTKDNTNYVGSVYIHRSSSTATYLDIWWTGGGSDGTTYSITDDCLYKDGSKISNYSDNWYIGCTTYGDWTRVSIFLPLANAEYSSKWEPIFIPRNGYANWTCLMVEDYDGSSYAPTSWIPYGTTRNSDYDSEIVTKSNRTTVAYYQDSHGVLSTAKPFEIRPNNICSTTYINYVNDESAWTGNYYITYSSISIPSGFQSGQYISYSQSQQAQWSNIGITLSKTFNENITVSFFLKPTYGNNMYVNMADGGHNYAFVINSDGSSISDTGVTIEKVNNGYYYVEISSYCNRGYITFGCYDNTNTFSGIVGNFRVIPQYDEYNMTGNLIEVASQNYCSGDLPTSPSDCSIKLVLNYPQKSWLLESPNTDQWSNVLISHSNTNASLICTASIYIKPLEDGTIAINNGAAYNSSFTFTNGIGKYNGDGGDNVLSAGISYVGNGVYRIWQERNDGFILNSASNIGLQNVTQTKHFMKCIIFCCQLEPLSNTTSWIPYGTTRTED